MNLRTTTLTAIKAAKQADLDREWKEKNPEGVFQLSVQEYIDPATLTVVSRRYLTTQRKIELTRITERNTSCRTRGLSGVANFNSHRPVFSTIGRQKYLGWSHRRRNHWEAFVTLCRKQEVPEDLIQCAADLWNRSMDTLSI